MTVPASDLAEAVRLSIVIACAQALRGDEAAMGAAFERFCGQLDKLIAAVRTEARDDLLHGPAGSRRWNITPRADGGMDVCRGEHERSAGCATETFMPEKHTTDALDVQRVLYRHRNARALAALRKAEWGAVSIAGASCPCCHRLRSPTYVVPESGHAPDCEIDAALKEAP